MSETPQPNANEAVYARTAAKQGEIPSLASDAEIRAALDRAFAYRGDVTITRRDGTSVEGYIFDRKTTGPALGDCAVRIYLKDENDKLSVAYNDIARLEFSGRDCAAGKSFETWIKKYTEAKLKGEVASQ